MKIQSITTSNFLGARAVELQLTKPVALIAGKNYAGKSSIQEAVRMALTGETVRVDLKKDYAALITEGQESGFAAIETGNAGYEAVLPSGKGNHSDNAALPYVLDAQRFARMTDNERRAFLFGLMGIKLDGAATKERLMKRGCNAAKAEQIMPILRTGFDAASKEAASRARDAKASWKTATGGETWGKDKAAKWQPPTLEFDAEKAEELLAKVRVTIAADDQDIGALQQEIGAAKAERQRRESAETRRQELHNEAEKIERIQARINHDTADLAAWEEKVAATREKAGTAPVNPKAPGEFLLRGLASVTDDFLTIANNNPGQFDESLINRASTHLAEYKKLHGWPHSSQELTATEAAAKSEAIAKLPEYENALALLQRSVANGKRDLEAAKAAKVEYDRIVAEQSEPLPDVGAKEATLKEITTRRDSFRADERKYADMARQAAGRDTLIKQVAKLHQDVLDWTLIADALAPDGIPAELLAEALDPINEHLRISAANAEWEPAQINADMTITYGLRHYALISESEKWRADAMIAEAVSHISGVKLLVLDRFDVLDLKGREDALYWLDGMAEDGDIETALLFGTLKALPAQLLPNIEGFWVENGMAGQIKEAA